MSTVVERMQAFNQGRDARLLQLKYQAMRASAFAFLRGSDHLFYEDWPAQSSLNEVPPVWLCGDLHWQNLGSYKGDNRLSYFQVSDFDEAVLGPATWDLARFLVSILLSAQRLDLKESQARKLGDYFLKVYQKELRKGNVRLVEEDKASGLVKSLLFQIRTRDRNAFLDGWTTLHGEKRQLLIDGKRMTAATRAERVAVGALVEQWGARQPDHCFFEVLDVAHRIAGIGSLGVERYVVLIEGKGSPGHNYLLDLKAEAPSSLQPYLTLAQPRWSNNAERVVAIQRWVQGIAPALLAAVELDERWYLLRELQPNEDKINVEPLKGHPARIEMLIKTIAQVMAWGALRSGGRQGSATADELLAFAQAPHWQDELVEYARTYTEKVKTDYEEFRAAYDQGTFNQFSSRIALSDLKSSSLAKGQ